MLKSLGWIALIASFICAMGAIWIGSENFSSSLAMTAILLGFSAALLSFLHDTTK